MRFNEAVEAQRRKAAEKDTGANQSRAQEVRLLEHKRAFAAAFKAATDQDQQVGRRAYHDWMHTSYDLAMMKALGFSEAKPRIRSGQEWSDQEVEAMLQCLASIASGDEAIHTRDPFYYISHHGMLRQKSPEQQKALLKFVERNYTAP